MFFVNYFLNDMIQQYTQRVLEMNENVFYVPFNALLGYRETATC